MSKYIPASRPSTCNALKSDLKWHSENPVEDSLHSSFDDLYEIHPDLAIRFQWQWKTLIM